MDLPTISLATGIGGLDLGVLLAGRILGFSPRHVCYVEGEAFPLEHLAETIQEALLAEAPCWSDITTFSGVAGRFRHKVGLLTAGLPCQPFSVAGKRLGDEDGRYLWHDFFAILRACQPPLVFVENVPGLLVWFEPIGQRLSDMGYTFEAGIYSSAEVGGSHLRRRFFALGHCDRGGFSIERTSEPAGKQVQAWDQPDGSGSAGIELQAPPLPGDTEGWAEVIRERPDLKPAVLRVADESPDWLERCLRHRIDRIRAVGNAVDPVVAAVAFMDLARKGGLI